MDNSASSKTTAENLLQKMVTGIKACIAEMKEEFEDNGALPLTDDSPNLNKFCGKFELLLQIGMKERTGIFGGTKNYWDYLQECLSNNKNLKDGIRFVKSRAELKTNVGKGRSFIRFSLVHRRLADTVQYCLFSVRLNGEWYYGNSLFYNRKLAGDLVTTLYDLNDIQFDLDPKDSELDTCWPTFSRRPAGMACTWRPPSRTGSITSLSSIPNLEIFPNLSSSLTPNIEESLGFDSNEGLRVDTLSEDDLEGVEHPAEVAEITAKYDRALQRIEELTTELAAKKSGVESEEKLVEQNLNKVSKTQFVNDATFTTPSLIDVATQADEPDLHESQNDALTSTIVSLQQQLMAAVKARDSFSEKSDAADIEIQRLKKVEDEVEQLRHRNLELNTDMETLHKDLREIKLKSKEENFFEKAFGDVMHEKATVESLLEQARKDCSDLDLKLTTMKESRQELQEKLDSTVSENRHLLVTISDFQISLDKRNEMAEKLESELSRIKAEMNDLQIYNASLQNKLEDLETRSQDEYQTILTEKDETQRLFNDQTKSFEALILKNSSLEEQLKAMMEKERSVDVGEAESKKKISDLEDRLTSNEATIGEKISETKRLEESCGILETKIKEMEQRNETLESEKLSLTEILLRKTTELAEQDERCLHLTERLTEVETALESQKKSSETSSAESERLIQDLKEDLEALTGSVQRREKMWESARISMDKDIVEKSTRIQRLEQLVAGGFTKEKLEKMERKANDLEETLEAVKLEQEVQLERAHVQLDDLKQCLGTLEHEKFLLLDELNQKDELLVKERKEFQESRQSWTKESKSLNNDIDELKRRIIKLIKEKADLWQKTDDLSYDQKLRSSYQWMNSAEISNCLICQAQFSMTIRKHHCRKCGRVLCFNCCNNWVSTPHSGVKERACNECISNESFLDTTVNSIKDDESDIESIGEEPVSSVAGSRESGRTIHENGADASANESSYLTCHETSAIHIDARLENGDRAESEEPVPGSDAEISENGVQTTMAVEDVDAIREFIPENDSSVPDLVISVGERKKYAEENLAGKHDDRLEDATNADIAQDNGPWSLSTSARAAVSWMSTAANATTSFAAGLIPRTAKVPEKRSSSSDESKVSPSLDPEVSIESSMIATDDHDRPTRLPLDESVGENVEEEIFDVISPEEVSESRLYQISDPNVTCCPVIRLCNENVRCLMMLSENELLVKAGKCFVIPISIEMIGLKLNWEFSTQPKGISFSVTYKESDSDEDCVVLVPLTRLNSHQQIVTGELKAKKLGVYALIFDNQSSRFTSKKLKYQLHAEVTEMSLQNSTEVDSIRSIR